MRLSFAALAAALLAAPAFADPAAETSLCAAGETVVFNCTMGAKTASVCAPPGSPAAMSYRFGKLGAVELTLASPRFSNTPYSGGGEAHLRFANGDYDYIVFDRTIRTGFGPEGNAPEFSAGLVVRKAGKVITTAMCRNDAAIGPSAYEALPREEFEDLEIPSR